MVLELFFLRSRLCIFKLALIAQPWVSFVVLVRVCTSLGVVQVFEGYLKLQEGGSVRAT